MPRNLAANLTTQNRLASSFPVGGGMPLRDVRSNTAGIAHVLDRFLSGMGAGQDATQRKAAMAAIQAAMTPDPAMIQQQVTQEQSDIAADVDDAEISPGTAYETPNQNRRSLQQRLMGMDAGGNPYVAQAKLGFIPGMMQAENAGRLATTKRAQTVSDAALKHGRALELKKAPGFGTSRPAAPIQNDARREQLVTQYGEGSPRVRQFDTYVRANKIIDFNDRFARFNPRQPGAPEAIGVKGVPPAQTVGHRRAVAGAEAEVRAKADIRKEYQERGIKSTRALDALAGVEDLIGQSTGSWGGAAFDTIAAAFGHATEGAVAVGKLKVLQANLMLSQPRMEGPQSDKDVDLYRQAAGQIGDPTVPNKIKVEAIKLIKRLHGRYAKATRKRLPPGAVRVQ